jgi:hypothetical protein
MPTERDLGLVNGVPEKPLTVPARIGQSIKDSNSFVQIAVEVVVQPFFPSSLFVEANGRVPSIERYDNCKSVAETLGQGAF